MQGVMSVKVLILYPLSWLKTALIVHD